MPDVKDIDAELLRRIDAEIERRKKEAYVPIPDASAPPLAEAQDPLGVRQFEAGRGLETSLEGKTVGLVSRPSFEAIGGTVGTAVGAAGGMASAGPPGALAGGMAGDVVGSMAGSLIFDGTQEIADYLDLADNAPPEAQDYVRNAYKSGRDAMIYGPIAQMIGASPSLVKAGLGKILGVTGEVTDDLMRAARNVGMVTKKGEVALGVAEAATPQARRMAKIYLRVAGVFPFIGTPFRKASMQKSDAIKGATDNILNRLAPNATLQSDIGINMADAAEQTFDEFRHVSSILYKNFRNEAARYGKVIPAKSIIGAADEFGDQLARGQILTTEGEKLPSRFRGELADYINSLRKLPDRISMEQFDEVVGNLSDMMNKGARDGVNIKFGTDIKKAAEVALAEIDTPALKEAYDTANSFYSKGVLNTIKFAGGQGKIKTKIPVERFEGGKSIFETPTAKQFVRADKRLFEPGFGESGSINRDQLVEIVKNMKSPEAIRDLRKLVGDDAIGQIARDKVGRALQAAAIEEEGMVISYSADAFRKTLGLRGENALSQETFDELLKSTGVDLRDFNDLLKLVDNIEIPRSVATFVARRGIMGGLKSAIKSALPLTTAVGGGAAVGGAAGIVPAVVGTLFLRFGAKLLAAPEMLTALRKSVSPSLTQIQKRQMLGRVIDYLQETEEPQPAEQNIQVGP